MPLDWVFDIGSLMVLVGEAEEQRFRPSRRTFIEALVAAPVAGIQTYLKSFRDISVSTELTYFSPSGGKWAPLRNTALYNVIRNKRLLDDGNFTVFTINSAISKKVHRRKLVLPVGIWAVSTWLCFGGIMLLCRLPKDKTWIGVTNCATLTGWSILLRVIELAMIKNQESPGGKEGNANQAVEQPSHTTKIERSDAVFLLGDFNSGIVVKGTRQDIKKWTASRLDYDKGFTCGIRNRHWQNLIRGGTFLVLILVFSTLANGSTTDQIAFVLLNALGQANVFLCLHLNATACESGWFDKKDTESVTKLKNRTELYGRLVLCFKDEPDQWISKAKILPDTKVWEEWRKQILKNEAEGRKSDFKQVYDDKEGEILP